VFSNLLALINPPVAGVKGSIKETGTNKIIEGVQLTAQLEGEIAKGIDLDESGHFSQELKEGKYTITVSAAGYVSQTIVVDLKLTGLKTENFELVKI
jgi:hypothetical protein